MTNNVNSSQWWRWLAVPFAVVAVFVVVALINSYILRFAEGGLYRLAQEKVLGKWLYGAFNDLPSHLIASMGAIYVGCSIAPKFKKETAIVLSTIGIVVSIILIAIYGIGVSRGILQYENTISTFCGCAGIVAGCIICFISRNSFD